MTHSDFPATAPCAYPVFYRSYSRSVNGTRETWGEVNQRTLQGVIELGRLTPEQAALVTEQQTKLQAFCSGRWFWVGGTDWIKNPKNFPGAYNCVNVTIETVDDMVLLADLGMQGCGTGAGLELKNIAGNFPIHNRITLTTDDRFGAVLPPHRQEATTIERGHRNGIPTAHITVGDSREGWVEAYRAVIELSMVNTYPGQVEIFLDFTHVRPTGEILKGFGGVANPSKLPQAFQSIADLLTKAVGTELTPLQVCFLIDYMADAIVAGGIRHVAGMRQFSAVDREAAAAKLNLWVQDDDGKWQIDPKRDVLRMANHTRVFHRKPTKAEILEAVKLQYESGEGAIQYAPEAIARGNADLLTTDDLRREFLLWYEKSQVITSEILKTQARKKYGSISPEELEHRLGRYRLNPCGEIIGERFFCDLAEINTNLIDPWDVAEQKKAFSAGAYLATALLHHRFTNAKMQQSREWDPIVAICPTGIFDHFVHRFGVLWLEWWQAGRPTVWGDIEDWGHKLPAQALEECLGFESETISEYFKTAEAMVLNFWREIVEEVAGEYCHAHGLRVPNRLTSVQPSGTKSLLTGASSGWHPPKAAQFIRRITFQRDHPVALACRDYGYKIIPALCDKGEDGKLLEDPFDPRCTKWLVEIPTKVSWADLEGVDAIDISRFSALAQFDFYMQVQTHYTRFNTSATIELRQDEIDDLATAIWEAIDQDKGYISAALLARYDDNETFPRLPFEPIDRATFERLQQEVYQRRTTEDFHAAVLDYDAQAHGGFESGPMPCDSEKCEVPLG